MTRIEHLNCATLRPPGGEAAWGAAELVCHCLLVETGSRLILVDTGIGLNDLADPSATLEDWFVADFRPALDPDETAVAQVRNRGYAPEDVTDVVLTHPDRDHAGGVPDFAAARVHLTPAAREDVLGTMAKRDTTGRVRPGQWPARVTWGPEPEPAEPRFGLMTWTVPDLPEMRLVDLPGHSPGHAGVLVATERGDLLHAGDAYFHPAQLDGGAVPEAVTAFTVATDHDAGARQRTQRALGALATSGALEMVSAHDPVELERSRRA